MKVNINRNPVIKDFNIDVDGLSHLNFSFPSFQFLKEPPSYNNDHRCHYKGKNK